MTEAARRQDIEQAAAAWPADNRAYLDAALERLRLLLQWRVLWLRSRWRQDSLQNYQGLVISDNEADRLLAGDDAAAEADFYRNDHEAVGLGRRIAALEHALDERAQRLADAGTPPALYMLAHLFGLTGFEREVLLLCLAPELDPGFERLYGYVQDETARLYPTPHLALSLLAREADGDGRDGTPAAARDSFLPEAPLRRFALMILESGAQPMATLASSPMRLDRRIVDYLLGINRPDEQLDTLLRPVPERLLAQQHGELVDRLFHWSEANAGRGNWPLINLTGPVGVGKRAVARALAERLGLRLHELDTDRLPAAAPERKAVLRLLEREAVLLQLACYLNAGSLDPADQAGNDGFRDTVEQLGVLLIVGSRERWRSERRVLSLAVPKPDAEAREDLWRQALEGTAHALDTQLGIVVQQFDFGPREIIRVVTAARDLADLRSPGKEGRIAAGDLWQSCRDLAGQALGELAQPLDPGYAWDDIVLPEDVLSQLREIAAQVAHRARVYEDWGFGEKLSRGRGIAALFAGPSGTGKTMAAEVLAGQLELDLYRIDLAGVVSKYIGETEKNLRKVFDAAERSGAILFFDEADALFGKRTEVKDSHDRYANIEVNYLLQCMEEYRGLAILATNRKSALDRAFLRRLRFLVDFPFPDTAGRRRIWQQVFPDRAECEGLDYDALARLEISGGNIHNIALNAAFLAADEDTPVRMHQVLRAARREYAKIDKILPEAELGLYHRRIPS